jgi:hypothetical protein
MPASGPDSVNPRRGRFNVRVPIWPFVVVAVLVVSALVVVATRMRPGYDPYGWLVWGHQTLQGNLNTDGAPSWKALTFLFTLPYSLAGRGAMNLWMVTSTAGALLGAVCAARIAYRLAGPCPGRRYAPLVAGAFAGAGVLGIETYSHLVLIANSDPLVAALCLAAIDAHLSRRPRLAFLILVLASLGRPEAWPFAGLYALWSWHAMPSTRVFLVLGLAVIPALSFGIPALTSKSWLSAANLDLNSVNALHGDKFTGVIGRLLGLYELPMWLAVLTALLLAVVRRDRVALSVAGAAFLWVAVEIAFAYHGFSAVNRYLIEPAAVLVTLAGAGVGWVLAGHPRLARVSSAAGLVAVLALAVALVPTVRNRASITRGEIEDAHRYAAQDNSLELAIKDDGGATRIRACGQPVTGLGHQSVLAWDIGLNVGNVGYRPGKSIDSGIPIVFFRDHDNGWQVLPIHIPASDRAACDRLKSYTAF